MAELSAARAASQSVEHVIEGEAKQPPVVISEQEVVFSTAAAVTLPRTKPSHRVIAALRAMFLNSSENALPAPHDDQPRRYPPRRDAFLEQAAMAREMRRL